MNLPPFFYVLAFWQALAYVITALVAAFTRFDIEAIVLLQIFLAILKAFQIVPQMRARMQARKLYDRLTRGDLGDT